MPFQEAVVNIQSIQQGPSIPGGHHSTHGSWIPSSCVLSGFLELHIMHV